MKAKWILQALIGWVLLTPLSGCDDEKKESPEETIDTDQDTIPATDPTPPAAGQSARSLYVSIYAENSGQNNFPITDPSYHILGDQDKEDYLVSYLQQYGFDEVLLYNLRPVLLSTSLTSDLRSFITRLHNLGIAVVAIGGTGLDTWDRIAAFHNNEARFDGLITEIEFWTGDPTFETYTDVLAYIKDLNLKTSAGNRIKIMTYLGRFSQEQADEIVALTDVVYLHCYVKEGTQTFSYGEARFTLLNNAAQQQGAAFTVHPIFSAEGEALRAGSEVFMGDWLSANSLDLAESLFNTDFTNAGMNMLQHTGYTYYAFYYLERYVP